MEDEKKELGERNERIAVIIAITISAFAFVLLIGYLMIFGISGFLFGSPDSLSPDNGAKLGDFVGGVVGTLFSGATVLLVYLTYKSQKKELQKTIIVGREQSITSQRQRFENTFFKLIDDFDRWLKEKEKPNSKNHLEEIYIEYFDLQFRIDLFLNFLKNVHGEKNIISSATYSNHFFLLDYSLKDDEFLKEKRRVINELITRFEYTMNFIEEFKLEGSNENDYRKKYYEYIELTLTHDIKYLLSFHYLYKQDRSSEVDNYFIKKFKNGIEEAYKLNLDKEYIYPKISVALVNPDEPDRNNLVGGIFERKDYVGVFMEREFFLYLTNKQGFSIKFNTISFMHGVRSKMHSIQKHSLKSNETLKIDLREFIRYFLFKDDLNFIDDGDLETTNINLQMLYFNSSSGFHHFAVDINVECEEEKGKSFLYNFSVTIHLPNRISETGNIASIAINTN